MTVSIIIPHWNHCRLLADLLDSISKQNVPPRTRIDVVVVDNGSSDDSVSVAEQAGARVLRLETNQGVARALNLGIRACESEWVALVNNDVVLAPDWLATLIEALERRDLWFAAGKVLDFERRGRIDGAGDAVCRGGTSWRLGHGREDGPLFDQQRLTYFPSATAVVFRRAFFEKVGFFEESFFAYLEDVDLGLRAALGGLKGVYVPGAVAYHRGGATAGTWSPHMVEWMTANQLLLLAKFYPARLMLRLCGPIAVAQLLWALMAFSRGRAAAWLRGMFSGARRFASIRRRSRDLRGPASPLAAILSQAESEIERVQRASGWDTYWRWYFQLAGSAPEARV